MARLNALRSEVQPMPKWLKILFAVLSVGLVVGALAFTVFTISTAPSVPDDMLTRDQFRCLAVSESVRTVAYARQQRKKRQIARIERLLEVKTLEALDQSKLKAEYSILLWEVAESNFQERCAESYFEPGSSKLRTTFGDAPVMVSRVAPVKALKDATARVPERLIPHGFNDRAGLYLSVAAAGEGDWDEAQALAEAYLKKKPNGLFSDGVKLALADAHLNDGRAAEAARLYTEVGTLRIGFEAHYARYRSSAILRASGKTKEADAMLADVRKWGDRGERAALVKFLDGEPPMPPLLVDAPR